MRNRYLGIYPITVTETGKVILTGKFTLFNRKQRKIIMNLKAGDVIIISKKSHGDKDVLDYHGVGVDNDKNQIQKTNLHPTGIKTSFK